MLDSIWLSFLTPIISAVGAAFSAIFVAEIPTWIGGLWESLLSLLGWN